MGSSSSLATSRPAALARHTTSKAAANRRKPAAEDQQQTSKPEAATAASRQQASSSKPAAKQKQQNSSNPAAANCEVPQQHRKQEHRPYVLQLWAWRRQIQRVYCWLQCLVYEVKHAFRKVKATVLAERMRDRVNKTWAGDTGQSQW